ncbi:MAG: hypothetical protein ABSE66_04245 [Thermoplasmata archaeon]|jgi:hypothetical protein
MGFPYRDPGRPDVDVSFELLLLKVAIAPAFIGIVSLIALRYGHRAAGWLVALPINTGTILFILVLTEGTAFAATAALGALLGIVSLSVFAIGYARSAMRYRWPVCLGIAATGFVLATIVLSQAPEMVAVDLVGSVLAVGIVLALLPRCAEPMSSAPAPRWEIPLRMLTAALLVLAITTAAESLGPRLSGLLSPIPVFTITLVIFTHSRQGPAPVFVFLGGLQYGLFSFAAFCAVVAVLLGPYGLGVAISAGLGAFLGVYGLVRTVLGRFSSRPGKGSDPTA